MTNNNLATRDLNAIWHPCSQMKDYEQFKPLEIKRAYDSFIELSSGERLIDAVSSWWCKALGHNHPALKQALQEQLDRFEHVIFANTTFDNAVDLAEELIQLMPHLGKVFYAGDGSCAIEAAMKMSVHSRTIMGTPERSHFVALQNGYHGETAGAMSVSDVGLYRKPYESILFETTFIEPPYVSGEDDPLWSDASDHWQQVLPQLEAVAAKTTAIIFEPIVQGAGGMQIYSADFLKRLAAFAKANDIHLIADEIMTGLGRTGKMLACEHAGISPDFICLSKALTSGWLPLSAVLTTNAIYDLFYDDYVSGKAFLHSHTFSGNALAIAVAKASVQIIKEDNLAERAQSLQTTMMESWRSMARETNQLHNLRGVGAIVAADLVNPKQVPRLGYTVYQQAVSRGALLRPLGNTLYWLPPLNIAPSTLLALGQITHASIMACCGQEAVV